MWLESCATLCIFLFYKEKPMENNGWQLLSYFTKEKTGRKQKKTFTLKNRNCGSIYSSQHIYCGLKWIHEAKY